MAYDTDNVFAQILEGKMPAHKVFENEHTFAFMDIMPVSVGHTLIIPKAEAENIFDLENEPGSEVFKTTKKIAHAIQASLKPTGLILTQLNGTDAGQTVFHYHMHIIPVYEKMPLRMHGKEVEDSEALAKTAKIIEQAVIDMGSG
jgi:histidine triad (HIT) family protein